MGAVRLLIVEDDPMLCRMLTDALRAVGYAVDATDRTNEAEGLAETYPYDAMVVDVGLADGPDAGLKLVARLREGGSSVPVLFLTGRDGLDDRVAGLDVGGDDYLVKPAHLTELFARLRALTRRARPAVSSLFERGGLRVDWTSRAVHLDGAPVRLTAKEYGIFEVLASYPGRLFSREEIIERVWDTNFDAETNVIDVYVRNLRRKLGEWTVETVRGLGYRFPAA